MYGMFAAMSRHKKWGMLVLRAALGLILAVHGYDKLFGTGVANVAAFFATAGLPIPAVLAWVSAIIETFGGLFLILGLLLKWSALLVALEFLTILLLKILLWKVPLIDFKTGVGGFQLDLLIFAGALALLLHGSDKWALANAFHKKEAMMEAPAKPAYQKPEEPEPALEEEAPEEKPAPKAAKRKKR
jgi:putative oxidoreductase